MSLKGNKTKFRSQSKSGIQSRVLIEGQLKRVWSLLESFLVQLSQTTSINTEQKQSEEGPNKEV